MENLELLPQNVESDQGDPREPPLCGEEEGDDHQEEGRHNVLVQQDWATTKCETYHQLLPESKRRDHRPA